MSRFEKTTHFAVKINFEIRVLMQSTVNALPVALCCTSIAEIRLLKVCKHAQRNCEKVVISFLLPLHQAFCILSVR